jgi:6-phosphogluconolactonase
VAAEPAAEVIAVYVSNADSGEIGVYRLDAARGELAPLQTVPVGGQVMPLALGPDRRFLYAARRSDPLEVLSFAIDPKSGELAALGAAPLPHSMANNATDRSGRWLFSASYGGDLIAVSPIGADGVAQPAHQVLATAPHAHAIVPDPSNRFVFATSLGGGHVMQWRFDAATGRHEANDPPALAPHAGASPRHLAFGAGGRFVYLLNELDAALDVLAFDAAAGALRTVQTISSLPAGFDGAPWAADLHLSPDGRFLYSSERRSNTLAAFRIDPANGELALLGHTPTEAQPRGFAITPDGAFLIAAGQLSNRLSVYAIDPRSGALDKRSGCAAGLNPNWIEIVALDA